MNLSDAEVMMLEQLTYFGDVNDGDKGKTIGQILSGYTEAKLVQMESSNSSDVDRAAIIRYMKNNEELRNLVLHSTMKDGDNKTLALCFMDKNYPEEAVVAFKGTTSKEWGDNIEGLNSTDTERQIQARKYIEELPFDGLTVVGHSKGGNKAMYVAICCEKVNRCISMDGQGFSKEFIETYGAEISRRAGIITNYSVSTDYVHVLLFQIPGSKQIYCQGYRIGDDIKRHHEPFSFFQIDETGSILCEDGVPVIVTEKNGVPIIEDPSVVMLHQFTTYVLNVATPDEKERIVNLIATSADMIMAEGCSTEEMAAHLLSDTDDLSLVLAYLVKYMDTYDLTVEDIDGLLQMLGLNTLDEYFSVDVFGTTYGISDVITLMQDNLTDEKKDPFINVLLAAISKVLDWNGIDFNLEKFWKLTENKINKIPSVSKVDGIKEPQISSKSAEQDFDVGMLLQVDTTKLRVYAERLEAVNKRLRSLDQRMDELYFKVGLRDLFNLLQADLLTGSSWRISNCANYLDETANDFDSTERNVAEQF